MTKPKTGLQARLANATGVAQSTISNIFNGKRRATPEQAIALEPLLIAEGFSITRWDLMACPRGTRLLDLEHLKQARLK
jgi:plasmid maintenance system antidote protein VapI